jgi:dTDP-D-glucose 4,6-dehydratase
MCYVKDCRRAIAPLQTAGKLNLSTYNVDSGYATKTKEVVEAIKCVVPDAELPLIDGRDPNGPAEAV